MLVPPFAAVKFLRRRHASQVRGSARSVAEYDVTIQRARTAGNSAHSSGDTADVTKAEDELRTGGDCAAGGALRACGACDNDDSDIDGIVLCRGAGCVVASSAESFQQPSLMNSPRICRPKSAA